MCTGSPYVGSPSISHYTSFDGIYWVQTTNPTGGDYRQLSFNVGRYNYLGYTGNITYSRSYDGINWSSVGSSNFSQPIIGGNPAGAQNLSGNALNKGYTILGNFIMNPSRLTSYLFATISPLSAAANKNFFRSVSNDPTKYIYLSDYGGAQGNQTKYGYSLDNIKTLNQITNTAAAVSLVTNHDMPPPPPFELSNLSFMFFYGAQNYISVRQPNVIGSQSLINNSTITSFNDALFVMNNGSNNNVGFGSVMPRDYGDRYVGTIYPGYTASNYVFGGGCNTDTSPAMYGPTFSTIAAADIDGQLRISDNALKPAGTYWVGYSDKRIKENIQPANLKQCYGVLSTIQLKHFSYISSYIEKYNLNDISQLGFIAQEVSTIFPKSTGNRFNVLSNSDVYYDLSTDQLEMSHYGTTQFLISSMYSRSSLIGNQMIQLETFAGIYSTIQRF